MNVAESVVDIIGKTPMLKCSRYMKKSGISDITLFAKMECMNPAGSTKDRAALYMIEDAKERGLLKDGATIIEPTSGNTGIGMASIAASMGYHCILTMPETMSEERRTFLRAYGAEIVLTDGSKGMAGSIAKAKELNEKIEGSIILGQFDNPANAKAHQCTTGPEIWQQLDGKIDVFIATIGTGGTITGNSHYLKKMNPEIKIIGVEPANSPVLSGGKPGHHGIQGIGGGFIPEVLDTKCYDEIITVKDEDAFYESALFARSEGMMVGISSGAALKAAKDIAARTEFAGKNVVVLLTDSGDRYLSTDLF